MRHAIEQLSNQTAYLKFEIMSENITNLDTHNKNGRNNHSDGKTKIGYFLMVSFLVGFFFLLKTSYFSSSHNSSSSKSDYKVESTPTPVTKYSIVKTIEVDFSGDFAETTYLPSGFGLSFSDASQPYCVKNKDNVVACGKIGEDVSPKLSVGHANMELKFKSDNGLNGHVSILLWEKK